MIIKNGRLVNYDYDDINSDTLFIPQNLVDLEYLCFFDEFVMDAHFKKIIVDPDNPVYSVRNGCLVDVPKKTVVLAQAGATIPSDGSVENIRKYAFYEHKELCGTLNIPEGIREIGSFAFRETGITAINLPQTLCALGSCIVDGVNVDEIVVHPNNPVFYVKNGCLLTRKKHLVLATKWAAVESCCAVSVGEDVFCKHKTPAELVIPEGVACIGYFAFANVPSSKLVLPATLSFVTKYSFQNTCFDRIYLNQNNPFVKKMWKHVYLRYDGKLRVDNLLGEEICRENGFIVIRPRKEWRCKKECQ